MQHWHRLSPSCSQQKVSFLSTGNVGVHEESGDEKESLSTKLDPATQSKLACHWAR
eukprot:jgi/Mesvir1/1018/Mv25687-RA.1